MKKYVGNYRVDGYLISIMSSLCNGSRIYVRFEVEWGNILG